MEFVLAFIRASESSGHQSHQASGFFTRFILVQIFIFVKTEVQMHFITNFKMALIKKFWQCPALAIVVSCRTVLCLTAAPYAEAQLREMSQSFEERLTVGRGVINGTF